MKTFIRSLFMALVVMLFASSMQAQQTYDVKLVSYNSNRIALIKLLKDELSLGLKEAKELVESAPCIVLENAEKERADDLASKITAAGGTAEVIPSSVTKYDLEVAGVQVTSANAGDLSKIPGVEGKVSYDPSTKTLTLEDASITTVNRSIYSEIDGLTIGVKGNCTISSSASGPIWSSESSFTIAGSGTLNVESKGNVGIYANDCALIIKDCTVNAKGLWGIAGNNGVASEQLTIDNATVTAEGSNGSISDFSQFTLNGCAITAPAGAVWNAEKKAVCDADGNKITSTVKIAPVEKYNLQVAGVQVTSVNAADLSVLFGVEGKVSYDNSTKTLTLEDATITVGQDKYAISSRIDGLTILVKGNCTLASENWAAIVCDKASFTIAGSGTLNAEAKDYVAIYPYQCALTIKDCTVNAKGTYGIAGNDGLASEQLTIDNATVTAEGRVASIADFSQFTLNGCAITAPAGAVWNAEKKAVCDADGNKITSTVKIAPIEWYALQVAGVDVTSANAADLSVIEGVEGKVSYDHSTKTLTLEDATITVGEDEVAILSQIDGLTIEVKGNSTLTGKNYATIFGEQAFTIAGSGTLNVNSKEDGCIFARGSALTIKDCTVNAKGKYGIMGHSGLASEQLTIDNATVTAEGSEASLARFSQFTLNGCAITAPAGAVWNAMQKAVCDADGNFITSKVTIAPVPQGIDGINAETARSRGIYNLHGVRLDTDFDQLPSGVYIVDGQKVMK